MKLTDEQFREQVRRRIMKGDAFILDAETYEAKKQELVVELARLTRAEILKKYEIYCHGLA